MRTRATRTLFVVAAFSLVAACSGGGDITESGDDEAATTVPAATDESVAPGDTAAAVTTTTVAPDTLPDCPTDALASATGTTEITFWHSMSAALGEEVVALTDAYNASQDKVKVNLVQGSYEETADNYFQLRHVRHGQ